jgi:putative ABC transport system permease protein
MLFRYVIADLLRNPRRTLSTMVGVTLGVGLFCGVLFFVDGLSASMTARAVAPLPIDIQRIVTERIGGALTLSQSFDAPSIAAGGQARVRLEVRNPSAVAGHEVTVRSMPGRDLVFVPGSAQLDGLPLTGFIDNPFASGLGTMGYNLGSVAPGLVRTVSYLVEAKVNVSLDQMAVKSTFSSRESVSPVAANAPSYIPLDELARLIAQVPGVDHASQLSLADLGSDALSLNGTVAPGHTKILGFDADYASRDATIQIVDGALSPTGAVISAEAARALNARIGDTVTATLPDGSALHATISGIADLSRSRSLFSSRRGGDLETFIYSRNSIVVSPQVFASTVQPAYERAATARGTRLKNPPLREIDVALQRQLLQADPATALLETQRIATDVGAVAAHQDYLLDNISNTLSVAAQDAAVAKLLFVFLGVPGLFLASLLAAYAGTVLAEAQRREQATLRIRGASRRDLLRMLTARTGLLTAAGSVVGLAIGYLAAAAILGQQSLALASPASLVTSASLGSVGGFASTGFALFITGRRTIDREINEDRALFAARPPLWRRARLDILGVAIVAAGTAIAIQTHSFDGAAGSVYFGRAVQLNVSLLVLPVAVWLTGSLLGGRVIGSVLGWARPESTSSVGRPLPSLYRLSIGRRPWAIANGAIVVALIVGLATSLAAFTASYEAAKSRDARYATGSDIRITPTPTSARIYTVADAGLFKTDGVGATSPVIYTVSNVILRSARTSDPANLAAIDPATWSSVAPLGDEHFDVGDAASALKTLQADPNAIFVSQDMASFLRTKVGDTLHVLLVRATPDQTSVDLRVAGLFERLPGFPDGADALMSIHKHTEAVPSKAPDFFLAVANGSDDAGLQRALSSIEQGPAATDHLQIDTRVSTLSRDQSSLAALNIAGLAGLDSTFALAMAVIAVAIFVFGLLLQRRREYVTLRAQGLEARTILALIAAEASTVAIGGAIFGLLVGAGMGFYFVSVLRPLFVLSPDYSLPLAVAAVPVGLVGIATLVASLAASRLVSRLDPTELLRDE